MIVITRGKSKNIYFQFDIFQISFDHFGELSLQPNEKLQWPSNFLHL